MGVGYTLGCLTSILLWNLERQAFFIRLDTLVKKYLSSKPAAYIFYSLWIFIIGVLAVIFKDNEIANFIIAFLVVDISSSEKENLETKDVRFHSTVAVLCRSLVCGMAAPLFYILIFGNAGGIIYFMLFNICLNSDYEIFEHILSVLTIIPALIVQIMFYFVYILKSRSLSIDFKGDFLKNIARRPLLNLEITAANIEGISFYYHFQEEEQSYVKLYGKEKNHLTLKMIKEYLGTLYTAAIFIFLGFLLLYVAKITY